VTRKEAATAAAPEGCLFPGEDFQALDAFEFAGIGGDEGRSEAARRGGDEQIQGADALAGRLQGGPDVGIVQGGIESEDLAVLSL